MRIAILALAGFGLLLPLSADSKKLTDEDRIEIIRGMTAEYATVKAALPRAKRALEFESTGQYNRKAWDEVGKEFGPAARVGDLVRVSKVLIDDDKIVFEINGGFKGGAKWWQRIEVGGGMGGGGRTRPVGQQDSNAPGGTSIVLLFHKPVPPLRAAELKKMLAPVLDFEKRTATESYLESLPPEIQKAVKEKKAVEGMDKDQVLLALGKPVRKVRETKDGQELEDWVYGQAPGRIVFVTFNGNKAIKVKETYAGLGSEAPPLPVTR